MSIRERVIDVIEMIACTGKKDNIKEDTHLEKGLGFDSLDFVESVMALETEFSIEIDDDLAADWKTVGDVVKYVEGKVDD